MVPPLTERILSRLPGPRALWMIAWATVGPLALVLWIGVPPPASVPLVGWTAVFAYANVVALWGISKIYGDLQALRPQLNRLLESGSPFRSLGNIWGPVLLAVILVTIQLVFAPGGIPRLRSAVPAVLLFVGYVPLATGLWVYFTLFAGLDRLGKMPVKLVPHYEDRSLGLRPFGSLAFSAFLMFAAVMGPVAVYTTDDLRDVILMVAIVLGGTAVFFMSLLRLRQKLVAEKVERLEWARGLYAQVYAPVEESGSLEAFMDQTKKLEAAEALEKRVAEIREWPFDDSILRTLAGILTGVIGAIVIRLILSQLGM